MSRRIEGGVGLLEYPRFPALLYTYQSTERTPEGIRRETEELKIVSKDRLIDKNGKEDGWGMAIYQNFYMKMGNSYWEMIRQLDMDSSEWNEVYKKRGASSDHSETFLGKTPGEFKADIARVTEEVGLNSEHAIIKPVMAREKTTDDVYADPKVIEVYIKLRAEYGYSHVDLAR